MSHKRKLIIFFLPFFLALFLFNFKQRGTRVLYNHPTQEQEECNPQEDADCFYNYNDEENNLCDKKYHQCIELCNYFDENCINSCEKHYSDCIEK